MRGSRLGPVPQYKDFGFYSDQMLTCVVKQVIQLTMLSQHQMLAWKKLGHLVIAGGTIRWTATLENTQCLVELNIQLLYDPAVALLGVYPGK